MKIGIIDDKELYRRRIKFMIHLIDESINVYTYEDGQDYIDHNHDEELICLDIDMPELSGLGLKEYLTSHKKKTKIIFVTSHEHYMMDAFGMNVIGFVVKKNIERLNEIIKEYILYNQKKMITLNYEEINVNDIYYIDKEEHVTTLHLKNRKLESTYTLRKLMTIIDDSDFIYIRKDIIVNMNHIDSYNKDTIKIKDQVFTISRRMKSEVGRKVSERG